MNVNANTHVTIGGGLNVGISGVGTVAMHDNSVMTVTGAWAVGRGDPNGFGTFSMDGNSSLAASPGTWANLGGWNHNQGLFTMAAHATATFGPEMTLGGWGSSGTITLSGSATMSVAGQYDCGRDGVGVTTLNDYAVLNVGTWCAVGDNDYGTAGTGSMTLNGHSQVNVASDMTVGAYGDGVVPASLTVNDNATLNVGGNLQIGYNWNATTSAEGSNTFTVNGGVTTVSGHLIVAADGGSGTVIQTGGTVISTNAVYLGEGISPNGGGPGTAVYNLNGGVLVAPGIQTHTDATQTGTSGTLNFNGGILRASADNPDFIAADNPAVATMTVNVLAGGAKIDTNGHTVAVNAVLNGSAGDGGLTKMGSGQLTLTAANTYTGVTTVKAGTLVLASSGTQNPVLNVGGTTSRTAGPRWCSTTPVSIRSPP